MTKAKFNGPRHKELREFITKTERTYSAWQYKPSSETLVQAYLMNGRIVIFAFYEPNGWDVWLPGAEIKTKNVFAAIRAATGLHAI